MFRIFTWLSSWDTALCLESFHSNSFQHSTPLGGIHKSFLRANKYHNTRGVPRLLPLSGFKSISLPPSLDLFCKEHTDVQSDGVICHENSISGQFIYIPTPQLRDLYRKADRRSVTQTIPYLGNANMYFGVHRTLPVVLVSRQVNPAYIQTPCLCWLILPHLLRLYFQIRLLIYVPWWKNCNKQ